jgi:AcrR family transcriptional regulator
MTRRDDALDAALRLFAQQGYAATTTAQIEAAMGLTPGAGGLFRHVKSKQELLEAIIERAYARPQEPPPGPFRSAADALVQAVLLDVDRYPDLWRLLLREGRSLPIDMDAVYQRLIQPSFDQCITFMRQWCGTEVPDLAARVMAGVSALLYLRISQWSYGRTPGGVDEAAFVAVVEQIFSGSSWHA